MLILRDIREAERRGKCETRTKKKRFEDCKERCFYSLLPRAEMAIMWRKISTCESAVFCGSNSDCYFKFCGFLYLDNSFVFKKNVFSVCYRLISFVRINNDETDRYSKTCDCDYDCLLRPNEVILKQLSNIVGGKVCVFIRKCMKN